MRETVRDAFAQIKAVMDRMIMARPGVPSGSMTSDTSQGAGVKLVA